MNRYALSRILVGWQAAPAAIAAFFALLIWTSGTNQALFLVLNRTANALPDAWWASLTVLGDALIVLVLLGLLARARPDAVWAGLIAGVFGTLISRGFKAGLPMPRPPAVLDSGAFHLIGPALANSSFPSGHTLTAFLFAGVLVLTGVTRSNGMRWLAVGAAALVGLSRVAVGVHWPLDVACGAIGGWLAAWLGVSVAHIWQGGLTIGGQRVQLLLLWLCSIALFFHATGYPLAQWLVVSVAAAGCLLLAAYLHDLWLDEETIQTARRGTHRFDLDQA